MHGGPMRILACLGLVLLGCGDSSPKTPDAAVGDGPMIDGPTIDAAPEPVTVTVRQGGQPVMDVRVYFQNADSSLVSSALTDAQGKASALMQAGGYVTALDPYQINNTGVSLPNFLYTFAGVKPGDQLRLERRDATSIAVNITAPGDATATASSYSVSTTCSFSADTLTAPSAPGGTATGTVYLDGCAGEKVDFMIVTKDTGGNPVSSILLEGVTVSDQLNLDLTQMNPVPAYAAATQRSYTWTNVAANNPVGYNDSLITSRGTVFTQSGNPSGSPTATAMNNMPAFNGAANFLETQQRGGNMDHHILEWGPYSSTYSLDLGANLLPDLSALPSFDEPTHGFTWTESGGAVQPDFIYAEAEAFRSSDSRNWRWTIAVPRTGAVARFPTLPTDVYDYNMKTTDSPELVIALAKVPGGYDAVRAGLLSSDGPMDLIAGATGRISVAQLDPPSPALQRQVRRPERATGWQRGPSRR